jgi:hypothetical protein
MREGQTNWGQWIPYAVYVYNTTIHRTTAYTPFELVYGFRSEVLLSLRETPNVQYNYENYLTESRGRLHSAHEVARQKLISSKEKSKDYYDKGSETFEIRIGQKVLLFGETVHRGRSKKLSPQYIGPYEVLAVDGVNVTIWKGRTTKKRCI